MEQFEKLNPTEEIQIGQKTYKVTLARTDEEKMTGLSNIKELPEDLGMLFIYEEPQDVAYTMEDTSIPLDICFIDEEGVIISVHTCEAYSKEPIEEDDVLLVLEVNANSGLQVGDELEEFDEEDEELSDNERQEVSKSRMLILNENGDVLMSIQGGERILSIKDTKKLIKSALKAYHTDDDSNYQKVGKLIFKILDQLDSRDPEYVTLED